MKKILESTPETREYLESLPKVYMIACWAGYGVREFPFAGKCTTDGIPLVWDYDDQNDNRNEVDICGNKLFVKIHSKQPQRLGRKTFVRPL